MVQSLVSEYFRVNSHIREHKSITFLIDETIDLSEHSFENCDFFWQDEPKQFNFIKSTLNNCQFYGAEEKIAGNKWTGIVEFNNCIGNTITLNGKFHSIKFSNCRALDSLIDNSESLTYKIEDSEFWSFNITGKSKRVELRRSVFRSNENNISWRSKILDWTSQNLPFFITRIIFPIFKQRGEQKNKLAVYTSMWNKEIELQTIIDNSHFKNALINPYFFSVTCNDKDSVNLTQATFIDNWSKLRKGYSGVRLYIVLLLSLAFFLPLIVESLLLILGSQMEIEGKPWEKYFSMTPLWKVLLFGKALTTKGMIINAVLTVVLLFYNVIRMTMTFRIAKLREEEKFLLDAGYKKVSPHPNKYKKLLAWSKWLTLILFISVLYALWKVFTALLILVPVLK
ncbi:MAG: hypothetical protein IPM74_15540 [Crocinitomicaceae bacterium]|nr:hypothetical protein [Crocinitomicaceae bacterium]